MLEAVPARPLKPKTAAINAITKNVMAQLNITTPPKIKILSKPMIDIYEQPACHERRSQTQTKNFALQQILSYL